MSQTEQVSIAASGAERCSPLTLTATTDNGAWIVQGVAPPRDEKRMTEDGDGVWYARTVNEVLHSMVDNWETSLDEIMEEAIYTASDRYSSEVDDLMDIDLDTLPSAMVSCVRWDDVTGEVEYFNIGDAVATVTFEDTEHRICATDASLADATFSAEDQWRLAFSPEAIRYARYGNLPDHDIDTVNLFTTATDAAVEIYALYDSWDSFHDEVDMHGASAVVNTVHDFYGEQDSVDTISTRPGVQDVSLLSVQFDN